MPTEPNLPTWITLLCNRIMCFVVRLGCTSIQKVRCHFHPDVDRSQAQVLIANHRSLLDPPLIGSLMRANLRYTGRRGLWQLPILAQVVYFVGALPVDRGKSSIQTLKGLITNLKQGHSVLLFPEGTRTRNGRMNTMSNGYAMVARRGNAPVTPIYVTNTELVWPIGAAFPRANFRRMNVFFGKPIVPPDDLERAKRDEWVTKYVERWMSFMEDRYESKPIQSWKERA
ncbi:MAG: 1-acyl-sn-glycerol-3-phosphate acyltransferase [Planctomycetes bacterium]|nr:1-acyl-sn-glycerol-3-phosphate acyltransferase [Planctomycetota bacterium]